MKEEEPSDEDTGRLEQLAAQHGAPVPGPDGKYNLRDPAVRAARMSFNRRCQRKAWAACA